MKKNYNKHLEKHKKLFAVKMGYKSWNELRLNTRLQDCFRYLNELSELAIEELETEIKRIKEIAYLK